MLTAPTAVRSATATIRQTYTITAPDGTVTTRSATTTYTHVVLIQYLDSGVWRVHGMAGSAALAAKKASFFGPWADGVYRVLIVPIEVAA